MSENFSKVEEIENFLEDGIKLFQSIIKIHEVEKAHLELVEAEKQILLHELREPVQELLAEIDRQMALIQ